jgi:hypothetical protein
MDKKDFNLAIFEKHKARMLELQKKQQMKTASAPIAKQVPGPNLQNTSQPRTGGCGCNRKK